jgi:hypothetical protein
MARPRVERAAPPPAHGARGEVFGPCCLGACLFGWREDVVLAGTGETIQSWVGHWGGDEAMAARLWRELFPGRGRARHQLRRLLDLRDKDERDRVWGLMRRPGDA